MRTKSYREFFLDIDVYERRCRARNFKVGLIFFLALAPAFCVVIFLSNSHSSDLVMAAWFVNGTLVASLVLVTLVGMYVLISSRKFHKAAAPKCEACGKSIGAIDELTIANWRLADLPVRVKCRSCGYLMAAWN